MVFFLLFFLAFSPAAPRGEEPSTTLVKEDSVAAFIQSRFACLLGLDSDSGRKERRAATRQLALWYAARGYRPVWTSQPLRVELLSAVNSAADEGLLPADYHRADIEQYLQHPPIGIGDQARCDILLTDAMLSLATHLRYGKVDPERLDPNWNLTDPKRLAEMQFQLQNALASGSIQTALQEMRPRYFKYGLLREALARYRQIEQAGGWPVVPGGQAIRPAESDPRVPLIRRRLSVTGDFAGRSEESSMVLDSELSAAIRNFQMRHALSADGVVGRATLAAMNVTASERVQQLRVNLERYRWFVGKLEPTFVLVNIAGFSLQYVHEGSLRWGTRVIVGKPYRKTPVFKADIHSVLFNPRWVVPPTILAEDALPAIRKDPGYLSRKQLQVIDSKGRVIDPSSVRWSAMGASAFPYRLQQRAGDYGALGRIKFVMPNRHIVYLHDTPTKDLFEKSSRTFSSGCIRVENPARLAELLLDDSLKWNGAAIRLAIGTEKTRAVPLRRRVPVFILYLTAVAERERIFFLEDVYHRDAAVLKALNTPTQTLTMESCGF
ncbi:MAG: L,D-transpeptidase family protein [Chlorobium sp.]|nr:L,D-transpeptidase family protein [Chlorobium phaeovibrioides]NQU45706.1 L,D-transpeptidase family protein [Chlorobium sp.]